MTAARGRVAVGVGAGVATTLLVVVRLGLLTATPLGVEDNGDGRRLFCGVGLTPETLDQNATWKAGYVTDFAAGPATCGLSTPSSAGLVLRGASIGHDSLALVTVGWWYAVLLGAVVGLAAGAATAVRARRAAVLLVPVAPLGLATFGRFVVSTYAEPAGLLGVVALACGVAVLLVTTRRERGARLVAVLLVGGGGAVAAAAKPAYVPVLLVAVVVCAATAVGRRRPQRVVGPLVATVAVLAAAAPVWGAVHFQDVVYGGANVHDVVFTLALPELGPDGPAALGLPPEAAAVAGDGYFNGPPHPAADWWEEAVHRRPADTRAAAYGALARDPGAGLRALGVGLQATTRADLPYLADGPADPARPSPPAGDPGWSGARQPDLRTVLDAGRRPPWLPTALVLVALGAAASTIGWRRRAPAAARWCRAAGLGALTALGLVAAALAGDGYFEVFKHVWLAAYVLAVTALCLLGAAGAAGGMLARGMGTWAAHRSGRGA